MSALCDEGEDSPQGMECGMHCGLYSSAHTSQIEAGPSVSMRVKTQKPLPGLLVERGL